MINEQDLEHLKLLRIFYLIIGILHFPFALIPLVHITVGMLIIVTPETMSNGSGGPPPPVFGGMFVAIGLFVMILIASLGVCNCLVARYLRTYRRPLFCHVIAGLNCMNAPLGTALGVFTFLILQRPSVKELFYGPPME